MKNIKEYPTRDFYSAVILKTVGLQLIRLERGNDRFVTFIYEDPQEKAETILSGYWNRETKVVARDLVDAINELKTRIYEKP